jgi:exosortase/archaeosortase family protein
MNQARAGDARQRLRPVFHFAAFFLLLYLGLQALPGVTAWIIENATVRPAAALLGWLDPALQARAEGARLVSSRGGLQVLPGCEGTDLALLVVSAMLAAPLRWRWRVAGAAVALLCVFVLNQARLLVLLQVHLAWPSGFGRLHSLWLPLALVLLLSALVLAWTSRFQGR